MRIWLTAALLIIRLASASHAEIPHTVSRIAGSLSASLVVQTGADGIGRVFVTGVNAFGALGQGNSDQTAETAVPIQVQFPSGANIVAVAAGENHYLALDATGIVYGWGRNYLGSVGDGTYTDRNAPVQVSSITDAIAVFAYNHTSFAIRQNRTVLMWGIGGFAGLGTYNPNPTAMPLADASHLSNGIALSKYGSVYTWRTGQAVTLVSQLGTSVVSVLGSNNYYAVTAAGELYWWGQTENPSVWQSVPQLLSAIGATALPPLARVGPYSEASVLLVAKDGRVFKLDNVRSTSRLLTSMPIPAGIEIAASGRFNESYQLIRDELGAVWGHGPSPAGQLGDGAMERSTVPLQVSGLTDVRKIVTSEWLGAALVGNPSGPGNRLFVWRNPLMSKIGTSANGPFDNFTSTPTELVVPGGVDDVAVGDYHLLYLQTSNKAVVSRGSNAYGQCGADTAQYNQWVANYTIAGVAPAGTSVTKVAAGGYSSYALLSNGRVRSWGNNSFGQLGNGNRNNRDTPGYVITAAGTPIGDVDEIAAAYMYFALRISSTAGIRVVGNRMYAVGDGNTNDILYPYQIPGLTGVSKFRLGGRHNLALSGGIVRAWGDNYNGAFGTGNTNDPGTTLFQVPSLSGVTEIAATSTASFAFSGSSLTLKGWGTNTSGQLGNGTKVNSYSPTSGPSGFTTIAGGGTQYGPPTTLGIKDLAAGATAWAWGYTNVNSGVYRQPVHLHSIRTVPMSFDEDADGMDKAWEITHFGSEAAGIATADPDGDGLTNIQEFLSQTNPNSSGLTATNLLNDLAGENIRRSAFVQPRIRLPQMVEDQGPVTVRLLAARQYPLNQTRTFSATTTPLGTVSFSETPGVISDRTGAFLTFAPHPNAFGTGSFVVTVRMTDMNTDPAVIYDRKIVVDFSIGEVIGDGDLPIALAQTVTTQEEAAVAITLQGHDPEHVGISQYEIATHPANGFLTGTPPNILYTPNPNYSSNGTPDTFTFTVRAGSGANERTSLPGTVSVNVTNTDNDFPVAFTDVTVIKGATTPLQTGRDPEGDAMAVTITRNPTYGSISSITGSTVNYFAANSLTVEEDSFDFALTDRPNDPSRAEVHGVMRVRLIERLRTQIFLRAVPSVAKQFDLSEIPDPAMQYSISTNPPQQYGQLTQVAGFPARFQYLSSYIGAPRVEVAQIVAQSPGGSQTVTVKILVGSIPFNTPRLTVNVPADTSGSVAFQPSTTGQYYGPTFGTIGGSGTNRSYLPNAAKLYSDDNFANQDIAYVVSADAAGVVTSLEEINFAYSVIRPGFDYAAAPSTFGQDPAVAGFSKFVMERSDDGFVHAGAQSPHMENYYTITAPPYAVPLAFNLDFYGFLRSSVFIANNGNVRFDAGELRGYDPLAIRDGNIAMIGLFWADIDTRDASTQPGTYGRTSVSVYDEVLKTYKSFPAFVVTWLNCGGYGLGSGSNSFQLVIIDRSEQGSAPGAFDLEFNYSKVEWDKGSASNTSARVGFGSGLGRGFEFNGSGVLNAFRDTNASTGLINRSYASPYFGRYVIPFRNGEPLAIRLDAGPDAVVNTQDYLMQATASGVAGRPLSFTWTEITATGSNYTGTNPAVFTDPNGGPNGKLVLNPQLTFLRTGQHFFRLTVSDGFFNAFDTVSLVAP